MLVTIVTSLPDGNDRDHVTIVKNLDGKADAFMHVNNWTHSFKTENRVTSTLSAVRN